MPYKWLKRKSDFHIWNDENEIYPKQRTAIQAIQFEHFVVVLNTQFKYSVLVINFSHI